MMKWGNSELSLMAVDELGPAWTVGKSCGNRVPRVKTIIADRSSPLAATRASRVPPVIDAPAESDGPFYAGGEAPLSNLFSRSYSFWTPKIPEFIS